MILKTKDFFELGVRDPNGLSEEMKNHNHLSRKMATSNLGKNQHLCEFHVSRTMFSNELEKDSKVCF